MTVPRSTRLLLVLLAALLWQGCNHPAPPAAPGAAALMAQAVKPLSTTGEMVISGYRIEVELPQTQKESEQGLMYRTSMPKDHGMLFYYDTPEFLDFWMHNTRLPLSIAFIDAHRRIDRIQKMQPMNSEHRYFPYHKCVAALEMNQGWFKAHGITAGATVEYHLPPTFKRMPIDDE